MMKFLFMMIFMIPLSFNKKLFWLNQYLYLFMTLLFLMNFSFSYMVTNISYFLGNDLPSYIMILLSFWICSLMILVSSKLYNQNYYSNLFNFFMFFLLISLYCAFGATNLFVFYLFFKMSLIPVLV